MLKALFRNRNAVMATSCFIIFLLVISYLRLKYVTSYASSWDQVDFALAIERFDLLAMQPHFPGYPYFILGGMFFHQWIIDPVKSLAVFNVVMISVSTLPMFLLARRYLPLLTSLFICVALQSLSFLWITSTESMSEACAISGLWWYLWSVFRAIGNKNKNILLPLLLFSILMGIRLSYLSFGIGIIVLLVLNRKLFIHRLEYSFYVARQLMYGLLLQLIWVVGLILSEGSIANFLILAIQFVNGHFTDWGGAITAVSMPVYERFFRLVFYNIIWIGICGRSPLLAILLIILIMLISKGLYRKSYFSRAEQYCYFLFIGGYFLWALFAQNIDKPRHALPIIVFVVFSLFIIAVKSKSYFKIKLVIIIVMTIIQTTNGFNYVKEKANSVPSTYQLSYFLEEYPEPFIIYTWEEARIMDYLKVNYPYEPIYTYEHFIANSELRKEKKVFITDHVLDGFLQQGIDVEKEVKMVRSFESNRIFDPVYHKITLYEWIK